MPFGVFGFGTNPFADRSLQAHTANYIDNHKERAYKRLLKVNSVIYDPDSQDVLLNNDDGSRIRHSYILGSIIQGIGTQVQQLEDGIEELLLRISLEAAQGELLDFIGKRIGLRRNEIPNSAYDDEVYRTALIAKNGLNWGQGEERVLSNAINVLTNSEKTENVEYYPLAFYIYFQGDVDNEDLIYKIMYNGKKQGISMTLINAVRSELNPFRFAANPKLHLQATATSTISTANILQADLVGVIAGDFANGQIAIYDGTGKKDVRDIDASGAVPNIDGISWDFSATVNFSGIIDATSYLNMYDYTDGLGLADNPEFNNTTVSGTTNSITTSNTFVGGDRANDWIVIFEGTGKTDIKQIDSIGAVASGPNWEFTLIDGKSFIYTPDTSSKFDIYGSGGRLAAVIGS